MLRRLDPDIRAQIALNPLQREMEGEVQRALLDHGVGPRVIVGAKLKACACGNPECLRFRREYNFGASDEQPPLAGGPAAAPLRRDRPHAGRDRGEDSGGRGQ